MLNFKELKFKFKWPHVASGCSIGKHSCGVTRLQGRPSVSAPLDVTSSRMFQV